MEDKSGVILEGTEEVDFQQGGGGVVAEFGALQVLPPEVWGMIFFSLDSKTLSNCYETCELFRGLLESKRTAFFGALGLPLLMERYLTPADILSCRLVCRHWKSAVDEHLQSVSFHQRQGFRKPFVHCFQFNEEIVELLDVLGGRGQENINPFRSRTAVFESGDGANFWVLAASLLEKCGDQVWYCEVALLSDPTTRDLYMKILFKLIVLMPNLRVLKFSQNTEIERLYMKRVCPSRWNLDFIQHLMDRNPLPVLKHLVELDICPHPIQPMPFVSYGLMKTAGPTTLTTLALNNQMQHQFNEAEFAFQDACDRFESLKEFRFLGHISDKAFGILKDATWPLKRIHLDLIPTTDWGSVSCFKMKEMVNSFGSSLEELSIVLPEWRGWGDTEFYKGWRFHLPGLKKLEIQSRFGGISCLDFTTELKNLRCLRIRMAIPAFSVANRWDIPQVIEVSERTPQEVDRSNIWDVLGKLEVLTINHFDFLTRNGHRMLRLME